MGSSSSKSTFWILAEGPEPVVTNRQITQDAPQFTVGAGRRGMQRLVSVDGSNAIRKHSGRRLKFGAGTFVACPTCIVFQATMRSLVQMVSEGVTTDTLSFLGYVLKFSKSNNVHDTGT